jgi:RHS repeat-associated protein
MPRRHHSLGRRHQKTPVRARTRAETCVSRQRPASRGLRFRWGWLLLALLALLLPALPSKAIDNGLATTTYSRTAAGHVYRVEATGLGARYTTYDLQGQPVWESDGAGNQVVRVSSFSPYLDSTVEVRLDGAGGKHTTSEVAWLDAAGLPVEAMEYASGKQRRTSFARNGSGFVRDVTNAAGFRTLVEPNFLGWPDKVKEESPTGYDVAQYTYNGRGQVTSVEDPSGLLTSLEYDGFGAVTKRTVHQSPPQEVSFTFDALGRLDTRTSAVSSVQHHYNARGDADYERLAGSSELLSSRTFDELGRVVESFNYNPALSWLGRQERTVQRSLAYDALGRVKADVLKVGREASRPVTSTWSLSGGLWQRALSYPGGQGGPDWRESFDAAGRLARKERPSARGHGGALSTTFSWEGDFYAGRTQALPGWPSPFTERVSLDELGQVVGLDYSALTLNGTQPANPSAGQDYCGGAWSVADCANPLYSVRLLRDALGRVVSDKSEFGYPVLNADGNRVPATHSRPWKGFGYDAMSRLSTAWTHSGVGGEVTTGALATHFVTQTQVAALGLPAAQWQYQREATVGDLKAVVNAATGVARWQATNLGHQQKTVTVDGQARALQYDGEGRLSSEGGAHQQPRSYEYDTRGALAVVRSHARRVVEAYAYDDAGRMVATFQGGRHPEETFAYDGVQMVASYQKGQRPTWEAAWGPGVDRLLEWRDSEERRDYAPLVDYRGSVVAAWDEGEGRVRETAEYNPEGRLTLRDAQESVKCAEGSGASRRVCRAPVGMPFGFQSAWRSQESGLVYMRNRWYSTELGVFISPDALGYVDSFNPYAYAAFDPVNGRDPFGLRNIEPKNPRVKSAFDAIMQTPTGRAVLEALDASPIMFEFIPYRLPDPKVLGLTGNDEAMGIVDFEMPTGGAEGRGLVKIGIDLRKTEGAASNEAVEKLTNLVESLPPKMTAVHETAVAQQAVLAKQGLEEFSTLFTLAHELGHGLDWEFGWTQKKGASPEDERAANSLARQILWERAQLRRGADPRMPDPFNRFEEPAKFDRGPRQAPSLIPPWIEPPDYLKKPVPRQLRSEARAPSPEKHKSLATAGGGR